MKTFIFDFDGTLANSLPQAVIAYNHFAKQYGCRSITLNEIELIRGLSTTEILKHLQLRRYKVPLIANKIRQYLHQHHDSPPVHAGIHQALSMLKTQQHRLGIVSSNSTENIERFCETHQFNFFDFVHTGTRLFGKARVLKKLMKHYSLEPDSTYYIGDEVRDIKAAQQCQIKAIGVSWGLNTKAALLTESPYAIIDEAAELLKY